MSSTSSNTDGNHRFSATKTIVGLIVVLWIGARLCRVEEQTLPTTHYSTSTPPISTDRCAECHSAQAHSLADAPHSRTLHRGTDNEVVERFRGLTYHSQSPDTTDTFEVRDHQLWRISSTHPDPVPIDWVFGSNHHAQTPVTVRETPFGATELIEHNLSHYPEVGLDLTLGSASHQSPPKPGWHGLGTRMSPSEAYDCFGCHSSWLPKTDDHLDLTRIVPGVHCTRCHQNGAAHVSAAISGQRDLRMERWENLSPLDSIRRCGECHRRDDQLTADELHPGNLLLVRFAPVGLSQSKCFTSQANDSSTSRQLGRMDCLTCHDPHQSASTDDSHYNSKCAACHGNQPEHARPCTDSPPTSNCIRCHMPKVEVQKHLYLTDHWIRRRR